MHFIVLTFKRFESEQEIGKWYAKTIHDKWQTTTSCLAVYIFQSVHLLSQPELRFMEHFGPISLPSYTVMVHRQQQRIAPSPTPTTLNEIIRKVLSTQLLHNKASTLPTPHPSSAPLWPLLTIYGAQRTTARSVHRAGVFEQTQLIRTLDSSSVSLTAFCDFADCRFPHSGFPACILIISISKLYIFFLVSGEQFTHFRTVMKREKVMMGWTRDEWQSTQENDGSMTVTKFGE